MTSDDTAAVKGELARRTATDPADWFLVLKARHGMAVVLRELAAHRGAGEVVTQILTCATAVNPVIVAGHRPVYAEISPATLALHPEACAPGPETRAIVLQHTFGMVDLPTAHALRAAADASGALLLEDAAHCVGRVAAGADGRPLADVSFHSFGVEKMLPTRFGGAVWVSPALADEPLAARIRGALGGLAPAGRRVDLLTRVYRMQIRVLNRLPRAMSGRLRAGLTRAGLFEPAIAPIETRGGISHEPAAPTDWMIGQMAAALPGLAADEVRRAEAVATYVDALGGAVEIPAAADGTTGLVRLPILAADEAQAERLLADLAAAHVYAGRWYRPALFPGVEDPAVYGYEPGTLPVSEDLVARIVNLPTNVSPARAREIASLVRQSVSG